MAAEGAYQADSGHEVHIARYFIDFVAEESQTKGGQLVVEVEKVAEHCKILSHKIVSNLPLCLSSAVVNVSKTFKNYNN